jgi:hypothetical protein
MVPSNSEFSSSDNIKVARLSVESMGRCLFQFPSFLLSLSLQQNLRPKRSSASSFSSFVFMTRQALKIIVILGVVPVR